MALNEEAETRPHWWKVIWRPGLCVGTPPPSPQSPPTPPSSALCTFLAATAKRAGTGRARLNQTPGAMRLQPLLRTVLWAALLSSPLRGSSGLRHEVYWNSSNPR